MLTNIGRFWAGLPDETKRAIVDQGLTITVAVANIAVACVATPATAKTVRTATGLAMFAWGVKRGVDEATAGINNTNDDEEV